MRTPKDDLCRLVLLPSVSADGNIVAMAAFVREFATRGHGDR